MSPELPVIRELPQQTINLIAAGEVVERPASIVKELVENSLDANASQIQVEIENGGINSITVTDHGHGMTPDSIKIAIKRHSTSKLPDNNLSHINSFGFRGEAIASIIAVSECTITSRAEGTDTTWSAKFSNSELIQEGPVKRRFEHGTSIHISKLFHNIPARRAFLRQSSTETKIIIETFKALAISNPLVGFSLIIDKKKRFDLKPYPKEVGDDALDARISDILGEKFFDNSVSANFQHESFPLELKGRLAIPTLNSPSTASTLMFVNGRVNKDRAIYAVIRNAYGDTIPKGRFPCAVLFIKIDPLLIDVNAHPAKIEIRLRQPVETKNILKHSIRNVIRNMQPSTSSNLSQSFISKAIPQNYYDQYHSNQYQTNHNYPSRSNYPTNYQHNQKSNREYHHPYSSSAPKNQQYNQLSQQRKLQEFQRKHSQEYSEENNSTQTQSPHHTHLLEEQPLGSARAQIMGNYIISESSDALIIVDQHAAHERIIYEKLKSQLSKLDALPSQLLLTEYIIPCNDSETTTRIMKHENIFKKLGFSIKIHTETNINVISIPTILKENSPEQIFHDFISTINETHDDNPENLSEIIYDKLFHILSSKACHMAVRGYAPLSMLEMNTLLRSVENTPLSSQCNHGRPAFISLKISDLETLFNRK